MLPYQLEPPALDWLAAYASICEKVRPDAPANAGEESTRVEQVGMSVQTCWTSIAIATTRLTRHRPPAGPDGRPILGLRSELRLRRRDPFGDLVPQVLELLDGDVVLPRGPLQLFVREKTIERVPQFAEVDN